MDNVHLDLTKFFNSKELNKSEQIASLAKKIAFGANDDIPAFNTSSLLDVVKDPEANESSRFCAWYTIFVYMRRNKSSTTKLMKFVDEFRHMFSHQPLFMIALSTVYMLNHWFDNALSQVEKALYLDSTNLGFNATYVDIVLSWANNNNEHKQIGIGAWTKTKGIIQFLIDENPKYAKYHYFYSQYLLHENDLEEAERQILLAINFEDEESNDYLLRISDYQAHHLKLRTVKLETSMSNEMEAISHAHMELVKDQKDFKDQINSMREEMKDSQRYSLQFITVFIAVISILLSSIKAISFDNTKEIIDFMLILSMTLLLFFSVLFGLIGTKSHKLQVFYTLLGMAVSFITINWIV
ncbi:TPA: hypothetical protein NKU34_000665 [Vibrio parahaemolyticus]|nr:hypothetical protein [Vibrio parahaemolyticus]